MVEVGDIWLIELRGQSFAHCVGRPGNLSRMTLTLLKALKTRSTKKEQWRPLLKIPMSYTEDHTNSLHVVSHCLFIFQMSKLTTRDV